MGETPKEPPKTPGQQPQNLKPQVWRLESPPLTTAQIEEQMKNLGLQTTGSDMPTNVTNLNSERNNRRLQGTQPESE